MKQGSKYSAALTYIAGIKENYKTKYQPVWQS